MTFKQYLYDLLISCGHPLAEFRCIDLKGVHFRVLIRQYNDYKYFIVVANGKPKEIIRL